MGGHGGLNILPQKRWNVYNADNREKVRKDEEAAAREEYINQQQQNQAAAELRLEKLREASRARYSAEQPLPPLVGATQSPPASASANADEPDKPRHINFFEGWAGFDLEPLDKKEESRDPKSGVDEGKARSKKDKELDRLVKRAKREAEKSRPEGPEDERCKLGYGSLGKNSQPWYAKTSSAIEDSPDAARHAREPSAGNSAKRRKTMEELREERLKRERLEREKTRRLLASRIDTNRAEHGSFSKTHSRPYYNSSYGNSLKR